MVKGKTETGTWPRSQSAVKDAFAGAIVAAIEDRYHESVAPVHYIGQQVSERVLELFIASGCFSVAEK